MPTPNFQNGNVYEGIEADPYDAYESWQDEASDFSAEFSEADQAESGRGKPSLTATIRRMQRQIYSLRKQLGQIGQKAGTPANLHRRLQQLESTTASIQQSQLMAMLLDQPQLESIRYAGTTEDVAIEHSSFDKQSLLVTQLLTQNGFGTTQAAGGNSLQNLLPLLLLRRDKGEQSDPLSTILLLSLCNK